MKILSPFLCNDHFIFKVAQSTQTRSHPVTLGPGFVFFRVLYEAAVTSGSLFRCLSLDRWERICECMCERYRSLVQDLILPRLHVNSVNRVYSNFHPGRSFQSSEMPAYLWTRPQFRNASVYLIQDVSLCRRDCFSFTCSVTRHVA